LPRAHRTDLVLTRDAELRSTRVEKFVEFFGPGLRALSVADRATIAHMAPRYGATAATSRSTRRRSMTCVATGRARADALVEAVFARAGSFADASSPDPESARWLELDLAPSRRCLACPSAAAGPGAASD